MSTSVRFQLRNGVANDWALANPILLAGEPGLDTTNNILKIGNGIATWDNLPAISGGTGSSSFPGSSGSVGTQGSIGPTGPQGLAGPTGSQGPTGPAGTPSGGTTATPGVTGQILIDINSGDIYTYSRSTTLSISGGSPTSTFTTSGPYAGNGNAGFLNGTTANSQFSSNPLGLYVNSSGTIFVSDTTNGVIRQISGANVTTFSTLGGLSSPRPYGLAQDSSGNLFVCIQYDQQSSTNNVVVKLNSSGVITNTYSGFYGPTQLCIDRSNNVYVTDIYNHQIKKIDTSGIVTVFCGSGVVGHIDGLQSSARFSSPYGICIDSNRFLYVSEIGTGCHYIRKIDSSGNVSTVAGTGFAGGADGPGLNAQLSSPRHLSIDLIDNIFIADFGNSSIRRFNTAGNLITTSTGLPSQPYVVAVEQSGGYYTYHSNRIHKYIPSVPISATGTQGVTGWAVTGKVATLPLRDLAGSTSGFFNMFYNPTTQEIAYSSV